ncbi:MAG: cephalosporin hydroxylase family protein [Anaerolineae bacterium]|nr:cephalosporin hydroxylase family protein [Anaerolineae bacterium]
MNKIDEFFAEVSQNIERLGNDHDLQGLGRILLREMTRYKYSYNFTWMGRPMIQLPQDVIAMQEIIWKARPDLIVETGVAHGGSIIFYASMLELLGGEGRVVGVDIDIRPHNRVEIENHPMSKRISLVEGSSIDTQVIQKVRELAVNSKKVLVILDSNHTHEHVLQELELYSPLVTQGSYVVVFDTLIEDIPDEFFDDRPWGKGNNPKTAAQEFLKTNDRFEIDRAISDKLLITVAPEGYLRCIKD